MARKRPSPVLEEAPDISESEMPQQDQQARPHPESSRLPIPSERRQSRRRLSKHGTYPEQCGSQWANQRVRARQLVSIENGMPDPPYPVTPPPLEQPQPVLPPLGYRAPTPLPPPPPLTVPTPAQKPDNKPSRLLQRQRQCARQLDASLSTLSLSALASGSILLVSAILFVRSVMVGTPHAVVGSLILGVLCRRARATKSAAARAQARQETELMETRSRASEGRLPMYDMRRRNAICELRDEPGVVVGATPYRPVQEQGRVINRRDAPPIRVASRYLAEVPFSRPPTPHPRPPLSSLVPPVPSTPPPPIPERNPARLLVAAKKVRDDTDADALSMTAQPSPESGVSPRTVPIKDIPQHNNNGTASGRSTQMFNQHMLTAGTRELQAYLDAASNSSLNTLAAYQHSESDSSSTHAIMSNDRSVYSGDNDQIDDEEESHIGEAFILSMRNVGKARECYIPASKSDVSAPKSPKSSKRRRSKLKVFTEATGPEGTKFEARKHRSMVEPMPNAPLLLSEQKSKNNQLAARRPQSLSPKKVTTSAVKSKAVGLGISIGREQGKENLDPDQTGVETWSALGDL
ncbi:hypothetical protein E4T50_10986 [Aureobasidium sp. EXF-12298]|nr:hypothetical protein E4T50_10986 [Aureobasidium sp. EXF-12298]KAI4765325.1 hypothetical protein E4T51_01656 [Aureobasidium sp. EXF-12344]KAI4783174.1 hypothetical protein E4T52_01964 [Aureobasidium sp. EXF-3400]